MTFEQLSALLARVQLPEHFKVEVTRWVRDGGTEQCFAIQLLKYRRDTDTRKMGWGSGGRYLLEDDISPSGVILRLFKALLAYDEHERREAGLLLDGRPVLGPHPALTTTWTVQ